MENKIVVIIPAYNEENSIAKVIHDLPAKLVTEIIVVDNNSTDNTSNKAKRAGATVLFHWGSELSGSAEVAAGTWGNARRAGRQPQQHY